VFALNVGDPLEAADEIPPSRLAGSCLKTPSAKRKKTARSGLSPHTGLVNSVMRWEMYTLLAESAHDCRCHFGWQAAS